MDTITLLDRFTYVGTSNDEIFTPWVHFPAHYKQAELWIDVKTYETGPGALELQTSMDTTQIHTIGSSVAVSQKGLDIDAHTAEFGPLVRLKLSSTGAARYVVSVWLVPKQD